MKLRTLALAMSVALPGLVTAQTLDFQTSVQNTLSQNPQRDQSHAQIDQAQAALSQASLSRLPQFNLSFTASNSNNPLNVFGMKLQQQEVLNTDFAVTEINKPGSYTDFNTRIEMLLPIWNGGKISSAKNQAGAMLEAAQKGDVAVQQMLTYYVYEAYEGVHAARSFIQVAEQALKAANAYVNTTRNLVQQGVVLRSELLSAQAHQAEAELMLEQAKNHEQMALDGLRSLMGMDANAPLNVAGRVNIDLPSQNVEEMTQMALDANPKLQAMRQQVKASHAAVRGSRADLYPSFNLMARHDWNDNELGFNASSYTVAAVASWKITDFGVTGRVVDQANAAARGQEAQLRAEEQSVGLNLLRSWRQYQNELKKVESNQAAVNYATEAQSLIARRYETGVSTMTEVLASQAQLDKARAELANAEYAMNIQKAQLRLATGRMHLDQM
ncbi:MAG: TolC family protein [Thiomicrospira sp.]|uniref:TolC family protein n=1 Tax=Thiomicrospira sp. TaxID=935 RepID=UPI001A0527D4|nr:TolC family protein [Thiomicrospira sp.]MBE0493692.1 TolC family protein [Thiomicrospira sp.]